MLHLVEPSRGHSLGTVATTTAARRRTEALKILKRYEILDTPPEIAFDRITELAAELLNVPMAIIGFFEHDRLWFKSRYGLSATQVSWGWDVADFAVEERIRLELNAGFLVGAPLRTADGYDLGALCVMDRRPRQVGERQVHQIATLADIVMDQLEQRLATRRAAERARVLAGEIDHRVMNSLQFVASLLRMQSAEPGPTATVLALQTAGNRVLAVARAHRHFSADEAISRVSLLPYLRKFCAELSDLLSADIKVESIDASVSTAQILAIGLVVNELVTNAKKHGAGPIGVVFTSGVAGQYQLCVRDEGAGLPEGFALDRLNGGGLGMKVVSALTEQLEGRLSARANPDGRGACFTVTFPAAERRPTP
jgi:two-component sensor histidine kinase